MKKKKKYLWTKMNKWLWPDSGRHLTVTAAKILQSQYSKAAFAVSTFVSWGWSDLVLESAWGSAMRWVVRLNWHTRLLPLHCVYSGSPSCRAQHGSRVCTVATLAWPRRMCSQLWSPHHQRRKLVCPPKHERLSAHSLPSLDEGSERKSVCV